MTVVYVPLYLGLRRGNRVADNQAGGGKVSLAKGESLLDTIVEYRF